MKTGRFANYANNPLLWKAETPVTCFPIWKPSPKEVQWNAEVSTRGQLGKGRQLDQPKITDALSSAQKYTRSSKRWKQLTDAVTKGIAKDMMPVYSVEKPGFRQMLTQFDSRYELPSWKYFPK